jgi:hypothetical protein
MPAISEIAKNPLFYAHQSLKGQLCQSKKQKAATKSTMSKENPKPKSPQPNDLKQ